MKPWCAVPAALMLGGCISFPKHITSSCAALPLPQVSPVMLGEHNLVEDELDGRLITGVARERDITDAILRLTQHLRQYRGMGGYLPRE